MVLELAIQASPYQTKMIKELLENRQQLLDFKTLVMNESHPNLDGAGREPAWGLFGAQDFESVFAGSGVWTGRLLGEVFLVLANC